MRNSYIATGKEAALLHGGQQTAIIVPMKQQPVDCSHIHKMTDEICEWRNSPMELLVFDGIGAACKYCGNGVNYGGKYEIKSPYALHHPVYVREKCYQHGEYKILSLGETGDYEQQFCTDYKYHFGDKPTVPHRVIGAGSMPKKAARTWFVPVEVQAVRVQDDIGYSNAIAILEFDYSEGRQFKNYGSDWNKFHDSQYQFGDYRDSWKSYIVAKMGQKAWDDNVFIWIYKIQKHTENAR